MESTTFGDDSDEEVQFNRLSGYLSEIKKSMNVKPNPTSRLNIGKCYTYGLSIYDRYYFCWEIYWHDCRFSDILLYK